MTCGFATSGRFQLFQLNNAAAGSGMTTPRPVTPRPATIAVAAARPVPPRQYHVVRVPFTPTREELETAIVDAIALARDVCGSGSVAECAVAWDVVEELSAAAADARSTFQDFRDPMDGYCADDESAAECRMYDV